MDCDENSSEYGETIDWSKCFICQEFESDKVLVNPKKISYLISKGMAKKPYQS